MIGLTLFMAFIGFPAARRIPFGIFFGIIFDPRRRRPEFTDQPSPGTFIVLQPERVSRVSRVSRVRELVRSVGLHG
jgi:hypothetical protein